MSASVRNTTAKIADFFILETLCYEKVDEYKDSKINNYCESTSYRVLEKLKEWIKSKENDDNFK